MDADEEFPSERQSVPTEVKRSDDDVLRDNRRQKLVATRRRVVHVARKHRSSSRVLNRKLHIVVFVEEFE